MKHFLLLLVIIVFQIIITKQSNAQTVLAPAGHYHESEQMSMSWTLGETIIATFVSADIVLTQGFQQPVLKVSTIAKEPDLDFQITAFPNPTRGHTNISTNQLQAESLTYRVYDLQGRFIIGNPLEGSHTRIAFYDYDPGIYFIRILQDKKPVKTFKIIKQ